MQITLLLMWLVGVFGPGHSVLANLSNEQVELMQYAYGRALDENVNPEKFVRLLNCESGLKKLAIGDKGKANGIAQFHERTFNAFSKKYGLVGTYKNPYSQINLAASMIGDDLASHWWNCAKKSKLLK